jgi:hypothetical protein
MFMFNGIILRKVGRKRWILSSLSSYKVETRIRIEDGTNANDISQAKDVTNVELGS